jgi:hypothetical protein
MRGFGCEATLIYMPTDLERSHDELRGALIVAGRHIHKLRYARRSEPILKLLREVLRNARKARREAKTAGA